MIPIIFATVVLLTTSAIALSGIPILGLIILAIAIYIPLGLPVIILYLGDWIDKKRGNNDRRK